MRVGGLGWLSWVRARLAARPDTEHEQALVRLAAGVVLFLYLLPEVRDPQFDEFHRQRTELRAAYRELAERVVADLSPPAPGCLDVTPDDDAVFRMVETLPNLRADGLGAPDQPARTADLAVHLLGWRGDWAALRAASRAVAAELAQRPVDEVTSSTVAP